MNYSRKELGDLAKELHVMRDTLEKVIRLAEILGDLGSDEAFKGRFALKGGTAINLMVFDLPRLSTDIDLNLSENISREELPEVRKKLKENLLSYMEESGYTLDEKSRATFSLDSLLFGYTNVAGNRDRLKMDLNYSLRAHVLPLCTETSKPAFLPKFSTTIVHPVEIYASKTIALMTRAAPRDLYDMNHFVHNIRMRPEKAELYRKATMFYLAVSSDVAPVNPNFDAMDNIVQNHVFRELLPVMRDRESFELGSAKRDVKAFLREHIAPTENEMRFLKEFRKGEYHPELIFDSPEILSRLRNHPMALWKIQTYRKAREKESLVR